MKIHTHFCAHRDGNFVEYLSEETFFFLGGGGECSNN